MTIYHSFSFIYNNKLKLYNKHGDFYEKNYNYLYIINTNNRMY